MWVTATASGNAPNMAQSGQTQDIGSQKATTPKARSLNAAAVGVATGALLALATLGMDRVLNTGAPVATENARVLLGATFTAMVTVGAFALWMRAVTAQLAASAVPSQVVTSLLHDREQHRIVVVTVAALTFAAIILLSLPADPEGSAPLASTTLGALLGAAAISALLVSIHHAERATRPGVLVAESARRVIGHIRSSTMEPTDYQPHSPATPSSNGGTGAPDRGVSIRAPATGWLASVAEEQIIAAAADGTVIRVEVCEGDFLIADWTCVATVEPPDGADTGVAEMIADTFHVSDERAGGSDLAGALTQFTDIAVHASAGSAGSPSTAYEAIRYLGAILHELALHDPVAPQRRREGEAVLIRSGQQGSATLAQIAVERVRKSNAGDPDLSLVLVEVLGQARAAAELQDRAALVEELERQIRLTAEQCSHGSRHPADIEQVAVAADNATAPRVG